MPVARISDKSIHWRPGFFRVFISHISKHKAAASQLQAAFLPHHICSFVAHTDIKPTREWEGEILAALNSADALVALMHRGFHDSKWTDQETGIAIGRGLFVIPVKLDETPYGFVGRYQALQGKGKTYEQIASDIFEALLDHKQTKRRMAEAIVDKFANSNDFENAKQNMALLKRVKYWDNRLTQRARAAVQENSQLSDAWGVPQGLESLIRKWTE